MANSHKNTSSGGEGRGNSGAHYSKIGSNPAHMPPAGASNSYEMVRKSIDRKDDAALAKMPYSREKMKNK